MATRTNAAVENIGVEQGGEITGLASVRVKPVSLLGTGIAYVSGGPLVGRRGAETAEVDLRRSIAALKREYVDRRGLVLRIAPCVGSPAWNLIQESCYEESDFVASARLPASKTILLDIDRPSAEILAGFAAKWRRDLKRAEREPIDVSFGQEPELFEEFQSLFDELVARKDFEVDLGCDFYAGIQRRLPETERFHVGIARLEGAPVAGVVASILGDTGVYLLGASSDAGRQARAAYLLQWKVILLAKALECRWYDLGGVDAAANPGVYRFKARMGGTELSAPGPYECAPGFVRQKVVGAAERAFRAASKMGFARGAR